MRQRKNCIKIEWIRSQRLCTEGFLPASQNPSDTKNESNNPNSPDSSGNPLCPGVRDIKIATDSGNKDC